MSLGREVSERLARLDVSFGRSGFDGYGISRQRLATFLTFLGFLHRRYFKTRVMGIEYVPTRGRAMLVANHSGGYAVDAGMLIAACFFEMDPPRLAHGMADKFLSALPFVATWAARTGQLPGLPHHALRLLEDERLLMVFPEGVRGTAKLYTERHTLIRFGSGFMRLALETKSPIVPVGVVGAGDAVPTILNLERLGQLLGVPYFPVTPYILPLPLPVRLYLLVGEPMRLEGSGREEDSVIEEKVEAVKDRIAALVERGRRLRGGATA
jgi:1-acyl-sn-glycerol-3-phosphate acyltransferase